jgi:hypothetical protein
MAWLALIAYTAWPPAWGFAMAAIMQERAAGDFRGRAYAMWMFTAAWSVGVSLILGAWLLVATSGASLVIAGWLYWHHRRRRDRAPKLSSAKGRAIIAALVRRAREAAKPHPVLRPVPGGAR